MERLRKSLAILAMIAVTGFASEFNEPSVEGPQTSVLLSDSRGYTLRFDFPDIQFKQIFKDGKNYTSVEIPGCGALTEKGKAELPSFTRLIRLPNTGGYDIIVTAEEPQVYRGVDVMPSQEMRIEGAPEPGFFKDAAFYQSDAEYPAKTSDKGGISIWRDIRVAPVDVYPVKYNPSRRELKFHRSVTVQIRYTDSGENEKTSPDRPIPASFAQLYAALSVGPHGAELDNVAERGAYLIISPPAYSSLMQDWADWKRRMGYYTTLVTTNETGTTENQIKTYIYNAYMNWETPPEYVVLVGDYDVGMPCFNITGSYYPFDPTDWPYTLIDGDDYFPEVFIGRLSLDNGTQATIISNKMLNYEKTPYMGEVDWYNRALMIADASGAESTKYTKNFCEEQLRYEGYTTVPEAYYPGASTSMIAEQINLGCSFVNYRGYGGSTYWTMNTWNQFSTSNVAQLSNGLQLPVVTSMVCGGTNFTYSTDPCFGEAWLRESNKGSVVFCGPSEVDTHTRFNNTLDMGMYWGMFREGINQFAPALLYAKMQLWLDYPHLREGVGTSTNSVGFYFYVYNILGDPGLKMWTRQPQAMTVNYPTTVNLGMNQFQATVTNGSGVPIPDAYVCIRKGTEIYTGGWTESDGSIVLPMGGNYTAGTMEMTITGKNLLPYLQNVTIQSSAVTLGVQTLVIDDDNTGGTSGNGDHLVSPSETVDLQITVKNYSATTSAQNVTGTLTSTSSKVTIIQGTQSYGTIAAQGSVIRTYRITASSTLSEMDDLGLHLNIVSAQGTWNQSVWVEISAAEYVPLSYTLTPALEPGQDSNLSISVINTGLCSASGVMATLVSLDPMVSVTTSVASFGAIVPGDTAVNIAPFVVRADGTAYPGRMANMKLNFNSTQGYQPEAYLTIQVGTVAVTDPMGPDAYGYYCYDSFDTDYSEKPTYSWVELHNNGGTQLSLSDYGDEQDDWVSVDLPFTFRYYGVDYSDITVCSNGFISMGESEFIYFRNKALPGAASGDNMIAAFWDDLYQSPSSSSWGRVYKFIDTVNHRFIIEWYNAHNDFNAVNERFEIILLDPAYYPTATGDGEIIMQYYDVNDVDTNENFSTVGIQNADHTIGLQYVFSDIYPASSRELADGLAIKFTTDHGFNSPMQLNFTCAPSTTPVQIPPSGGTFQYLTSVQNQGTATATFDFWTEITVPSGITQGPLLSRANINLGPSLTISRNMNFVVPSGAAAGTYIFRGVLGSLTSGEVYYSEEFQIIKLAQ